MKKLITSLCFLTIVGGCSTTTTQQSDMSRAQLEPGMQRSEVLLKIGQPTSTSVLGSGDVRSDVYRQSTTNYAHGAACTAAGIATMGFGFIFCDGVTKKSVMVVNYRDDKLIDVRAIKK
jgi:hypothetical protein